MPEEGGRGGGGEGLVGGRLAIVKVDPLLAEEHFFQKLQQQVVETRTINEFIKKFSEVESGPDAVMSLVHILMRQIVSKPLGYIVHPETGASIIRDRIVQSATILIDLLKEEIHNIEMEIEKSLREGRDYEVEKNVRKMVSLHQVGLIAIREVMNRFMTLYTINLPSNMRPPLAQLKLGMEVISTPG